MKQSLHLKLSQQLTMTPQLQQAIRLLQLSTIDLQREIQQALDSNPMLEVQEPHDDGVDGQPDEPMRGEAPEANGELAEALEEPAEGIEWHDNIPAELPVDSRWDDVYQAPVTASPATSGGGPDGEFECRIGSEESLREHMLWQLNLTRLSDVDRAIALAILDATDDNGRLTLTAEEIHASFEPHLGIELDEVVAVLHRLQQFDPPGVCTRSLGECLLVQLGQLDEDTPHLGHAKLLAAQYIDLLGSHDYARIMRRARMREAELKGALALIQTLSPNPGQRLLNDNTVYITPDVLVSKKDGAWVVELNPEGAPRLRINSHYASLVRRSSKHPDNAYLRDNLQEARWFLKSLRSRNETLIKVASKIVEMQQGFLEWGEEAMKPLVLHDVAEAIGMHESTISRVTTQKYMHTPRGIFELKYFFSSHLGTSGGGECSATAARALIKKLVAAENPRKPLSDNKIAALLEDRGIKVARRTVAKYRESLMIPPSSGRKRLL